MWRPAGALFAGLWWLTQPVPDGIVNNSHPMHLFVGVVWLALAMAAQGALRVVAHHPMSRPTGRALPVATLAHRVLVAHHRDRGRALVREPQRAPAVGVWTASYLVLIVAGVALLAAAFGWVEDSAARRTSSGVARHARPGRPSGASGLAWRSPSR